MYTSYGRNRAGNTDCNVTLSEMKEGIDGFSERKKIEYTSRFVRVILAQGPC